MLRLRAREPAALRALDGARTSGRISTRRSVLEYPTETWAAQDMRKAEVF